MGLWHGDVTLLRLQGTHLLASLTRDTWGAREPRVTRTVCIRAVTLQEWHHVRTWIRSPAAASSPVKHPAKHPNRAGPRPKSLTRASSALGNWAKHCKKTQSHQGLSWEQCSAPSAPKLYRISTCPHGAPRAGCVWKRAQSLPSPASTCCFAQLLLCTPAAQADAWVLGSISASHPRCTSSGWELCQYSHVHNPRCRGLLACLGLPFPP